MLIGRDRELDELTGALADTERGRGRLVLVVGEPGIGKSRLADERATRAAGRGARVTWGRAWEAGGAPAYWPWIEVLRDLLRDVDRTEPGLAEIAQIVPDLGAGLPQPPPLEPAQAVFRLFDAVASLLHRRAQGAPLVILLDDLHAADLPTLSLLHFVSRGLKRAPVLLVGTYREVEGRMTPEVADLLARITREGSYLALARLDRDQVASLVVDSGVSDPALFVVEILRLLREKERAGAPAISNAIPSGVREVIRQRLQVLSPETRALLEAAAAVGRHIDLELLAQLAPLDRLAEASRADVLIESARGRVSFSHVLIRDVLYAELAPSRRQELHRRAAAALIARADAASLVEVVHHLFAAGDERAVEWARRAAAGERDRLAFNDAVELLERALSALPGEREAERVDVLLELAGAQLAAGQVRRGRETCLRAIALARKRGEAERLAHGALTYGDVFTFAVIDPVLVELLEEAVAALPERDGPLRARLLARLAAARQPDPRDPEPAMAIARDAIAMARRVADPPTYLSVLQAATSALLYFADPAERIPLNQELVQLAGRAGDKVRVLRGHHRLCVDYLEQGDVMRADASIEAYERLAREVGHPAYLWKGPLLRAMRRMMQGRFAEAEELAAEAAEAAAGTEEPDRAISFMLHRIGFCRVAARHDDLADLAEQAARDFSPVVEDSYLRSIIAGVQARLGLGALARATLGDLGDDVSWARGRMHLVWLAEVADAAGDAALAEKIHPLFEPIAGRTHAWGVASMVCEGPLARAQGLSARDHDRAARHFEDALLRVDALGAPPHRARIELEYAAMLVRSGQSGDRAQRLLDSAARTGEELIMPALVAAARALMSGAVPAPALPEVVGFELRREADFWAITCDGAVFRLRDSRGLQILARLVASPGREHHVTDLLAPAGEAGHVEDAGEALDRQAIAGYRERLTDLKEQLARAEEWNDEGRAAVAREEIEFLAGELARGVGLGGRPRRAAASSEKARVNVRRRLLDAIDKIAEHSPTLGRHLTWAVKTGTFCVYHPAGPRRQGTT
jgi:tetratricopeptide (TPR) repeat protein